MTDALRLTESRLVPGAPDHVFDVVLAVPLPQIFRNRSGVMPPISEVRDEQGAWSTPGQSRTIVTSDGGRLTETLVAVDRPTSFSYTLTEVRGPLRPLVKYVEGRWDFADAAAGAASTTVSWSWTLHPTNPVTARLLPVIGRFWPGYARKALAEIERAVG